MRQSFKRGAQLLCLPRACCAAQAEAGALAQATAAFNASLTLQRNAHALRCLACMAASLPAKWSL